MGCPHTPVPQFDRTMLRLCSALQLGPLALRVNGPSNSARRRAARPHWLSSTVPEPRHKSCAGHPILPRQERAGEKAPRPTPPEEATGPCLQVGGKALPLTSTHLLTLEEKRKRASLEGLFCR